MNGSRHTFQDSWFGSVPIKEVVGVEGQSRLEPVEIAESLAGLCRRSR